MKNLTSMAMTPSAQLHTHDHLPRLTLKILRKCWERALQIYTKLPTCQGTTGSQTHGITNSCDVLYLNWKSRSADLYEYSFMSQ